MTTYFVHSFSGITFYVLAITLGYTGLFPENIVKRNIWGMRILTIKIWILGQNIMAASQLPERF